MSMIDAALNPQLERALDVSSARQRVIANNMANIDTPNYRTKDIDFHSALRQAQNAIGETHQPTAHEVSGLIERPDGNNVDMDRESMALAETQLQFRTGIELEKNQFKILNMAIHDGRTA